MTEQVVASDDENMKPPLPIVPQWAFGVLGCTNGFEARSLVGNIYVQVGASLASAHTPEPNTEAYILNDMAKAMAIFEPSPAISVLLHSRSRLCFRSYTRFLLEGFPFHLVAQYTYAYEIGAHRPGSYYGAFYLTRAKQFDNSEIERALDKIDAITLQHIGKDVVPRFTQSISELISKDAYQTLVLDGQSSCPVIPKALSNAWKTAQTSTWLDSISSDFGPLPHLTDISRNWINSIVWIKEPDSVLQQFQQQHPEISFKTIESLVEEQMVSKFSGIEYAGERYTKLPHSLGLAPAYIPQRQVELPIAFPNEQIAQSVQSNDKNQEIFQDVQHQNEQLKEKIVGLTEEIYSIKSSLIKIKTTEKLKNILISISIICMPILIYFNNEDGDKNSSVVKYEALDQKSEGQTECQFSPELVSISKLVINTDVWRSEVNNFCSQGKSVICSFDWNMYLNDFRNTENIVLPKTNNCKSISINASRSSSHQLELSIDPGENPKKPNVTREVVELFNTANLIAKSKKNQSKDAYVKFLVHLNYNERCKKNKGGYLAPSECKEYGVQRLDSYKEYFSKYSTSDNIKFEFSLEPNVNSEHNVKFSILLDR